MRTKLEIDDSELEKRAQDAKTIFHPTKLNFLRSHLGFRPRKLHLFIAPPSGGKSTIRNTIMFDFLMQNLTKKIFIWLSEESREDFVDDLAKNLELREMFNRIHLYSEEDNADIINACTDRVSYFNEIISQSEADLIVFDNITTSRVYGQQFQEQEKLIDRLKIVPQTFGVPMVVFAHTDSSIKSTADIITGTNSVRGSKSLSNRAEFSYIIQNIFKSEVRSTLIRIDKHRGSDIDTEWYLMKYGKGRGMYTGDVAMPFQVVKELYKNRDKLL